MDYLGNIQEDSTINVFFTTHAAGGGAVAPSDAFEAADVRIYKGSSATEKATQNGMTMVSPFDSVTGLHLITIDTSIDTGDAGFWTTGADYTVILVPDTETVDSKTVVRVLGQFSIENRPVKVASLTTAGGAAIADYVLRRQQANVEASGLGDALALDSLYGAIQALLEWSVSGTTLTVKKTDGTTTLGTKTVTSNAAADPITSVS